MPGTPGNANAPPLSDAARKIMQLVLRNCKVIDIDWKAVAEQGDYKDAKSAAGTWDYFKKRIMANAGESPGKAAPAKRKRAVNEKGSAAKKARLSPEPEGRSDADMEEARVIKKEEVVDSDVVRDA